MRIARSLAGLIGLATAATMTVGLAPSSSAEPADPTQQSIAAAVAGRGTVGPSSNTFASRARAVRAAQLGLAPSESVEMPDSYPSQPTLKVYPDPATDATRAARGELIAYNDIAPVLQDWMRSSNRISTQVVGTSSQGRDIYLVTVTAPETAAQTAQQAAWKDKIKNDPVAAAADPALKAGYKTPIWFTGNLQGNEWEGTDAQMQVIQDLVTAPFTQVKDTLRNNRLYFSVTLNPDARVIGQRPTTLGLDPNRDMITDVTPESASFGRVAQAVQSLYMADLHGYTNVLQVEPTGPPHGENYEYDLFIPYGYGVARAIEDAVVGAAIPGNYYYNIETGAAVPANTGANTAHIKIPYRDTPSGWDDYPPIFSAQYAAYFGSVTSTVELPRPRAGAGGTQNADNAAVNKAVGKLTINTTISYVDTNSAAMLDNQIEFFRRGVSGAPKVALTSANIAAVPGPAEWKPLWDVADDQDPVTLPRAYVIPVGDTQRSASDATTVVNQLLDNGIEVATLDAATRVGATTYPAGSYVVDMYQPLRGLANALLDLGTNISAKVPTMYDISAWSYSYLWGATVDKVGLTTDPSPFGATTPITAATANAGVPSAPSYLAFEVAGVNDVRALNALLERGVAVSMLETGVAVVDSAGFAAAQDVATTFDIGFEPAGAAQLAALDDASTKGLTDLTVGYIGSSTVNEDWLALTQLGFDDLQLLNAASITATPSLLDNVDVLWVGSNLAFSTAQAGGAAAVQAWVDAGGSIVGRGSAGFNTARTFGLLSGTANAGNGSGNGIVAVDTAPGSVLAPFTQKTAFIYPATWFTDLGAGVEVEQTYATANPLLAGHWRASTTTNGPLNAAGQASVVSRQAASGARAMVFGTSVFFRSHPKGGMSQGARALFWAGPGTAGVQAPSSTTVTVAPVGSVVYPGTATFDVTVAAPGGVPTGSLSVVDQTDRSVVARGPVGNGSAQLKVAGLAPGTRTYAVSFTPSDPAFEPSTSAGVAVTVRKASSATTLRTTKVKKITQGRKGKVKAVVTLTVPGLPAAGRITILDEVKVLKTVTVSAAGAGTRSFKVFLPRGRHTLGATYAGSPLVEASSTSTTVRLRRPR